jgi:glycerol uptake facilitator-like aquaporin
VAGLGATVPAAGVGTGCVFAAEGIVTFILVLVVLAVATDRRVPQGVAGGACAATLYLGVLNGDSTVMCQLQESSTRDPGPSGCSISMTVLSPFSRSRYLFV